MLYDVDKHSEDRGSPQPNHSDTLTHFKAHGTHSVNYVTDASNLTALQPGKNGQFTIVKTGTATLPAGNFGSGVGSPNPSNQTVTLATIAHGLSFKPALLAYMLDNESPVLDGKTPANSYFPIPWYFYDGFGAAAWWTRIWCAVDSTNIYFFRDNMIINFASVGYSAHTVKYYLLQQTADNS